MVYKEKNRRSGQPNCIFLSRRSRKRRNETPLKVSDIMINARARTIDSAILFFLQNLSQKLALSVVVVLLQLLRNMHTTNARRKRFFAH